MDISGKVAGYRGAAIRCPGCGTAMATSVLSECEVDRCDGCGGLWLDWFDGEPRAVTREAIGTAESRPNASNDAGVASEGPATGACPRCTRHLVVERYAPPSGAHVELLRCEECAGAFVSRTSAETLAAAEPEALRDDAAKAVDPRVVDPLPWARLWRLLRQLFGLS